MTSLIDHSHLIILCHSRITGEPFFGNPVEGFIYPDEHLVYGSSEHSPSHVQASASGGFDFRGHPAELGHFLSTAVGHQQIFHGAVDFHPDESDDDDDDDDEMSEESDDAQSDGDESSVDELDE